MLKKIARFIGLSILTLVAVLALWLAIPRIISAVRPNQPPVGYYNLPVSYLAFMLGIEELVNRTPAVPDDVVETKNVEYKNINGKSLQLDFYKPKNLASKPPLLVFIHGGGWKSGSRSDYKVYLIPFAQKGYMTATVSYRFIKDAPYPACVEDITDAVQWLFTHAEAYGYDPDRIALIGGSAGAHLAMLAGYGWKKSGVATSDSVARVHRIKAVVDIYGPTDFYSTEFTRTNKTITDFMIRSYAEAPQLYVEASPVHYLRKDLPPTLIMHGTADQIVPLSQSDELKIKLDSLGVPNVYVKIPGWPHTMDAIKRVNRYTTKQLSDFFEKYVK